jgi:glycine hydroxymethyltransferase
MKKNFLLDEIIEKELVRQESGWNLIASENCCYDEVYYYNNTVMTNKYAEGTYDNRFYEGCQYSNEIEKLAVDEVKKLYGMPYANVQPHCGSSANLIAYLASLEKGDTILSMDFAAGGHLSHGHPKNITSLLYHFVHYNVDPLTHYIDYNHVEWQLQKYSPKMLISGASSYSRLIDYKIMHQLAQKYNAIHLVDMAHIAGLIAARVIPSPVGFCDIVTSTTHKTLRGPRSGFILAEERFSKKINLAVMPGLQGGPFIHTIAAKAWLFDFAKTSEFALYQNQIVKNCQLMISVFKEHSIPIISGGSDNHLFVLDLRSFNKTGKEVAEELGRYNIYVNKNMIPYDTKSPFVTSGIRIGTPFITAQNKTSDQIVALTSQIASIIAK